MKNQILEKAILMRVNKKFRESMTTDELFEITRGVWVAAVPGGRYSTAIAESLRSGFINIC